MPPTYPLVPQHVIELSALARYDGQRIIVTDHVMLNSETGIDDGRAAVNGLITAWGLAPGELIAQWLGIVVEDVHMEQLRAQAVYPTRWPYASFTDTRVGAISAAGCPANLSMSITKQSLVVGRGLSGGMRLAGLPANSFEGSMWKAAAVTAAEAVAECFLADLPGPDADHKFRRIIWSPRRPTHRDLVWDTVVQQSVRTMHRRTVGVGE